MNAVKRTLTVLTAAAVTATASAGTQTWDFSGGLDGWMTYGEWETRDGILHSSWGQYAFVGEEHWDNYTVEVKARIDKPPSFSESEWAGLIFRAQVDSWKHFDCYAFCVNLLFDEVRLNRISRRGGSTSTGSYSAPLRAGARMKLGEWFTLRAHVKGTRILLSVNNILHAEIWNSRIASGRIGLYSAAFISFDDLTVTGDSIEDRLQLNGKLAAQWAQLKQD
ncbi:MAG: DUF1080 domain-containing protein [Candidatus Poribacteria bacterium]|nr:DUF1080 domain-containing protein [Candidatus Poribacteria bacterium]